MGTEGVPARHSPVFTVVIPAYNGARIVRRAVDSVLRQTFPDLELIVVDDGSIDGTLEVLSGYDDARLSLLRQEHVGVSSARNHGASRARGRFLTFLDSDDVAEPTWLEQLGRRLLAGADVVCCGLSFVDDDGREVTATPHDLGPLFHHRQGQFLAGTYAMRTELFHHVGGFDSQLAFSENTELAMRLASAEAAQRWASTDAPLVRIHRSAARSDGRYLQAQIASVQRLLERHPDAFRRSPRDAALGLTVAAVCAAKLARWHDARRFLLSAIRWDPRRVDNYFRLVLVAVPPAGRRLWGRTRGTSALAGGRGTGAR